MAGASTNPTNRPSDTSDDGAQLAQLFEFARNMLDEEWRRTERLETRSRQAFGAAGALFAVVMATTAGILTALLQNGGHLHAWVYILLGVPAIISVISLGIALAWTQQVDRTYPTDAIDPQTILDYVAPARKGRLGVTTNLINGYAKLVRDRRANNLQRAHDLNVARTWSGIAATATLGQLIAIFIVLIAQ